MGIGIRGNICTCVKISALLLLQNLPQYLDQVRLADKLGGRNTQFP